MENMVFRRKIDVVVYAQSREESALLMEQEGARLSLRCTEVSPACIRALPTSEAGVVLDYLAIYDSIHVVHGIEKGGGRW